MNKTLLLMAVSVAAAMGMARAQTETATKMPAGIDVIAARQAGQDVMYGDFTGMLQAVKNKAADVKPFADPAGALAKWEKQFQTLFPRGTEHGDNTKALPAVWSDRAGFETAGQRLIEAAEKLRAAAKANDTAAFAAEVKDVGAACKACHDKFRAK